MARPLGRVNDTLPKACPRLDLGAMPHEYPMCSGHPSDNKITQVRIDYEETHLQHLLRNAGGVWDREKLAWELPYREVKALDLSERIIEY